MQLRRILFMFTSKLFTVPLGYLIQISDRRRPTFSGSYAAPLLAKAVNRTTHTRLHTSRRGAPPLFLFTRIDPSSGSTITRLPRYISFSLTHRRFFCARAGRTRTTNHIFSASWRRRRLTLFRSSFTQSIFC